MKTINDLETALQERRGRFIKGLISAGYNDVMIYNVTGHDHELLRLAAAMYTDTWDTFDIKAFEEWAYR